ncbi:hypothetical protein OV079_22665 [Nannocystis pusilla]|uniref:AraC family transcriptional regulator n=1 Tax=Nannocystis pusilla TaxID=889268 RepID=A0A9X3ESB8_9BACT|nr:hypothetical protein [Nannocystis pusilla]MCY1008310.1 hypothetical protein [Nannocystis pusilla]
MPGTETIAARTSLTPKLGLETFAAGLAVLAESADHRVRMHVGRPARGQCKHHRFVHTAGEIDVFPAGVADEWHQAEASTALVVSLTPSLLGRAAAETGRDPAHLEVPLRHQVRDPQIEHIVRALDAEHAAGRPGGALFSESLGLALAVRLLDPVAAPAPPRAASPRSSCGPSLLTSRSTSITTCPSRPSPTSPASAPRTSRLCSAARSACRSTPT